MDEQTIAKETRDVRLVLSDGTPLAGEVFLNLYGAHHFGPQRVGDLLLGPERFLPLRGAFGTRLVNIAHILQARVGATEEADPLMLLGERHAVAVTTVNGDRIEALLYANLPDGSQRVKDYLNQPLRFFIFFLPDEVLYLHRDAILWVED
ncbi:hypothetical protein DSOUD_0340 [Desulfuromonas soudanensis]|uniref:Uncharacterized protein n=1 Tax=Desulfuromonas soudanensis TaxID=1603606 RepID=A0A0M4D3U0_9BACT|nr:hypothetical protein [Desulfuromonas soudanensis]ALC15135.1 hypothetical protein DSOUD_0340 [Desulfuromonas soudanensis]